MKAVIKSILKTCAPLHIAHPDNLRMNDKGVVVYGDKDSGFPCTSVQKIRIPVQSNDAEGEQKTFNKAYPVIAGNNIAGRMRRHAAEHVLKAIQAKGETVSIHAYSVLQCGASTGKPDSEDMTYAEYKLSAHHPYFGLMGGGPKMFRRNLRVHGACPITPALQSIKGPLAHPQSSDFLVNDQTRFTAVWGFRRVDDLRDLTKIELAQATVERFDEEHEKRQALILEEKVNTKENSGSSDSASKRDRNSTKTYSALEFVLPGVLFDLTMELDVKTNAQVGLYLESLDSFAANERIGGYTRNGFGILSFENVQMVLEDGTSIHLFNNGRLDRSHPVVAGWLEAWANEAKSISAKDLDELIAVKAKPAKETREEKAARKKKAGTAEDKSADESADQSA